MSNIIEINDITFDYQRDSSDSGTIKALDHVTVNVERGSFTAIIGVNGSGKSTLAKNMNGLVLPTTGTVIVDGIDITNEEMIWNVRQTVGMVFQNPDNQLVSAVVEDDVAFGPENLGIKPSEIRNRVETSLKSVGMYDFRKKAPHMLSGGQKQRIAIAGVVAMMPECIVFDEPTAMLDPQGRKEVLDIILKLNHEDKKTVVLITHFMEEVAHADWVIVMDNGKIVMEGKPRDIFLKKNELEKIGLDVPFAADLAFRLREKGINIPENIIYMEELADYLKIEYDSI